MVLAAGDHAGGAALPGPGTHVAAQVVPLHVVVRTQNTFDGRAPVCIHPPPFGPGVLEPNLKNTLN